MMEQYLEVKNQYKDYLLFYRLGDFYEMFFDDAIVASRVLELTLTGRDCGEAERAPMCGVPYHSAESYIGRLIEKGYKVAICEQMEDPALAKGLVKREVVRVITPGTLTDPALIPSDTQNNYLCAVCFDESGHGVCFCDASTGEISATVLRGANQQSRLLSELGTYAPREVIFNLPRDRESAVANFVTGRLNALLEDAQGDRFIYPDARARMEAQFGDTLRHGVLEQKALVGAVGALLSYLGEMQKNDMSVIKELRVYNEGQFLGMDLNTRRNLELTETMRTKEKKGSLLWVLDKTKTAPGARLLRQWVEHPLMDPCAIDVRLGAVEELVEHYLLREELAELLSGVLDLERLNTRIVYGTANAKDLRAVATTAARLPEIKEKLQDCHSRALRRIYDSLDVLQDLYSLICAAIVENPPFSVREGEMIAAGYHEDVDRLRDIKINGKSWVEKIEAEEREKTGIRTLRISFNKVFGYYIEITKSLTSQAPERYIRKQTLSNCERYITQELKDIEATILGAEDKLHSLEYDLFQQIRGTVASAGERLQSTAALLAELDVYLSLATVASVNRYVRPTVDMGDTVIIREGRHPVVEQFVKDSYFVPNDVELNTTEQRLMLITGPNMAGKSTYMRQVALIVIMAQIGSFVPAMEAKIGVVDQVFTRVGASDDLASGQSTFMLEMNEVAYILQNATKQSLIIYDEVGRGTSTYDGMSIARAIVEYTNSKKIGAKTLFATHYHELTGMEQEFEGIVNYHIAAKKRGDSITFLRKIVRGSTDDSYGIEVAKLSGLPNEVIKRARAVLEQIEQSSGKPTVSTTPPVRESAQDDGAMSLQDCINEQVVAELKAADLNIMSPLEVMNLVFNLQKRLKNG
ncbi:MAG: DNA mismatch repair protein MutS [Clostridia bacterium]|nr:DNA mismatch repair protein MutS [Clostridia bacterium]